MNGNKGRASKTIPDKMNVLLLGAFGVGRVALLILGKTSIACKYLKGTFNEKEYIPTVEEKYTKTVTIATGEKLDISRLGPDQQFLTRQVLTSTVQRWTTGYHSAMLTS